MTKATNHCKVTLMQRVQTRCTRIVMCFVSLVMIAFPVCGLSVVGAETTAASPETFNHQLAPGEVPPGLSSNEWAVIQSQISDRPFTAEPRAEGGYTSVNPDHGWQIEYATDGTTRIQPNKAEESDYHLGFRLNAVGYGQHQTMTQPERIISEGTTVHYQWTDNLREWWVNSAGGLEQWFQLEQRPPGATEDQLLTLKLAVVTDLDGTHSVDALSFTNAVGTAISYDHLVAWDVNGQVLPTRMSWQENGVNLVIDDRKASYPVTIDPTLQQQAYIKASNTGSGDRFGYSVAISGDIMVVGAPYEESNATGINGDQSDNSASQRGAAYIFARNGTNWSQQAYLKPNANANNFGWSVAVDGTTAVVGAPWGVSGVYVFIQSGATWNQQDLLEPPITPSGDNFGYSVSVSGDTVVVGARFEDSSSTGVDGDESNNSSSNSGAAYVFTRTGTTWSQEAYLKPSNTGSDDNFGHSVAVSGNTIVVGAPNEDSNSTVFSGGLDNSATNAGAAYVFFRSGSTWSQQVYLKASNTDAGDQFGGSVAVYGDTAVVGAFNEASSATGVNGDHADNSFGASGAAYVFIRNGVAWSQQAYLKASNTGWFDNFGWSVAAAEDTLLISALREASNATGVNGDESNNTADQSGAAYLFTRSGETWSQQDYLKASNTWQHDQFGHSVALSGDTAVVGAVNESSNATGMNGDESNKLAANSGAAYVFTPSANSQSVLVELSVDALDGNPERLASEVIDTGGAPHTFDLLNGVSNFGDIAELQVSIDADSILLLYTAIPESGSPFSNVVPNVQVKFSGSNWGPANSGFSGCTLLSSTGRFSGYDCSDPSEISMGFGGGQAGNQFGGPKLSLNESAELQIEYTADQRRVIIISE